MTAYYNEFDPNAAAWLRELIKAGLIADGVVDERSIKDVQPEDLMGFTQCHFFAGIGGWSYALRLAGWADDRPVWTGSCPCQPFSSAGKGLGTADDRHLWPEFERLIAQCSPPVVFGEQVASAAGRDWLSSVRTDLEALGYAVGAADLCAAGVGAPHIRQRLWWVADACFSQRETNGIPSRMGPEYDPIRDSGSLGRLADAYSQRRDGIDALLREEPRNLVQAAGSGEAMRLADAAGTRLSVGRGGSGVEPGSVKQSERLLVDGGLADAAPSGRREECADVGREPVGDHPQEQSAGFSASGGHHRPSPPDSHWRDADWLFCRDGIWRPVESGTFPLAHGIPARVGRLRGYGNAIVPQVAAAFVEAYLEC